MGRPATPRSDHRVEGRRTKGFFPGGGVSIWGLLLVVLLSTHLLMTEDHLRVTVLRGILVLTALAEALAFLSYEFRPRQFSEQCGRPYDPAYHGVMQDFGFYNLAFAVLLGFAALDPRSSTITIAVIVASYVVHASTHFLRYLGVYFGGGHPIPARPQAYELRDGLQLSVPAVGMLLFLP